MAQNEKIIYAWLATFLTIIGYIIAIFSKKDDKYVMFYAKQGLIIFILWIVAGIFHWIPFIGWILMTFVTILWLISWINALTGEKRDTWLVQGLVEKLKI